MRMNKLQTLQISKAYFLKHVKIQLRSDLPFDSVGLV